MDTPLTELSLSDVMALLQKRECSSVEVASAYVAKIAEKNPELHAYLEVYDDVIAQAEAADARIQNGESAPLLGVPIALKDNILVKGRHASSGSKILEKYVATYDAAVVARLKKAGAVLLGRTNMDEFALGSSTENSAYGPTKNPHDPARVPGGTSGGSAAAVAAHMAPVALGSDTGGSIRQPSALCGVVGLKPTYGSVSRSGLMAAASSLDQIGVLARSTGDARVVYDVISGHDQNDSTSLPDTFFDEVAYGTHKKIGVPRAFLEKGVDPDVLEAFEAGLKKFEAKGYEVVNVDLPNLPAALPAYYIINPAEVSTNLARYDGIRYGLSVDGEDVRDIYHKTRGAGFGKETRRRILIGSFVLSSGYVDAYYRKATAVRGLLRDDFVRAFTQVDAIATPTTPAPAFKFGEKEDPLAMYAADTFTVPINLAGVPGLSVPNGVVERDGVALPVGFQLIGAHGSDRALLSLGTILE